MRIVLMMYVCMDVSVTIRNGHAHAQLGQPHRRCIDWVRGPLRMCIPGINILSSTYTPRPTERLA